MREAIFPLELKMILDQKLDKNQVIIIASITIEVSFDMVN